MREPLIETGPLLTQKVLILEVISQHVVVRVEVLNPVSVAKVAEEVIAPQMLEGNVLVDETRVAELAERVAAMRCVVRVALPPVDGQVVAVVGAALVAEDLEGLAIN